MAKMSFNVSQVYKHLQDYGHVNTVRSYWYEPYSVAEVEGIGKVQRTMRAVIDGPDDLEPYLEDSGFVTIEEWWRAITSFENHGRKRWVYYVEVVS